MDSGTETNTGNAPSQTDRLQGLDEYLLQIEHHLFEVVQIIEENKAEFDNQIPEINWSFTQSIIESIGDKVSKLLEEYYDSP